MPYRGTWLAIGALLALTLYAFWPGYVSDLAGASAYNHFHAATGFAWIALLMSQSWLVERRKWALHRWQGRAMLVVVPLFCASGFLVIMRMQQHQTTFRATMGDRLALVELIGVLTTATMAYLALRYRRSPALHGGFLLMSVLPLWFAVGTRLPIITDNVPATGLLDSFSRTVDVTMLIMLACAALAWWRQLRQPLPFQISMLATMLQWAAFYAAPSIPGWHDIAARPAGSPPIIVASLGLAVGLVAVWFGWQNPVPRMVPQAAM